VSLSPRYRKVAEHVDRVQRHQHVHGPPRVQRTARHVAEIDNVADIMRADIGQHGLQRQIVAVHIGNRSKAHASIPAACR